MSDISLLWGDMLVCPKCGEGCLHHELIEWWTRPGGEDSESVCEILGALADWGEDEPRRMPDRSHNPSGRREGIRIRFYCETCEGPPPLDIAQHKGSTFISWADNDE